MNNLGRRNFLKSLGTLGLAMIPDIKNGPIKKMFPLLIPAEEIIPGESYWYASTCRECPAGCGVMLKVRDGNVIKIEGNPNHPINLGGLCPRGQAALQELYSTDRIKTPAINPANGPVQEMSWKKILLQLKAAQKPGKTVILTGNLTGTQKTFIEKWLNPQNLTTDLVIYEPFNRKSYIHANEIVFNKSALPDYHLDKADFILSFGADFLETWLSPVSLSQRYSKSRRFHSGKSAKMIYIGSIDTLTAANADEEYKIPPASEIYMILALAKYILENKTEISVTESEKIKWQNVLSKYTIENANQNCGLSIEIIKQVGDELINHSSPVVLCGDSLSAHEQSTTAQVAVNILNYILGCYGKTVTLIPTQQETYSGTISEFYKFVDAMEMNEITNLIIYNTNPLHTYPDTIKLENSLQNVPIKIALATTMNETVAACDFILPVHHTIETWGIEQPGTNIYSLVQPGMKPIFESKSMENILLLLSLSTKLPATYDDFFKNEWVSIFNEMEFEQSYNTNWKEMLLRGGAWKNTAENQQSFDIADSVFDHLNNVQLPTTSSGTTLVVNYSHRFFDGRSANKAWLWEMPHELHHTVWDTPVRMHPEFAQKLNLKEGDIVTVSTDSRSIETPVLVTKDIHPSTVALEMGAGHSNHGKTMVTATGNPLKLIPVTTDYISGDIVLIAPNITIKKTEKWRKLVRLQGSYSQGNRKIIQQISLKEAQRLETNHGHKIENHHPEIYPEHKHEIYDWTMIVDLSACTGCGACVVACYAENNVPIVGKLQCSKGREMAWLRIERFEIEGRSRFIPMMCQQCEHAPCETVCPVYATVHSSEGLNLQVYNRCVGTRYCSNNCPYKVRRFNYFQAEWLEPANKQLNPDIYHRPKGVMEKCTFCVHRIRRAKEEAKLENRLVKDEEVMPACAQSCPAKAITFGNINDPESKVSKLLNDFRGYSVFEELNTKPSVVYLKGIKHG